MSIISTSASAAPARERVRFSIGDEGIVIEKQERSKESAGPGVAQDQSFFLDPIEERFEQEKAQFFERMNSFELRTIAKLNIGVGAFYECLRREVQAAIRNKIAGLDQLEDFQDGPVDRFIQENVGKISTGMRVLSDKYDQDFLFYGSCLLDVKMRLDRTDGEDLTTLKECKRQALSIINRSKNLIQPIKDDIRVLQQQMIHAERAQGAIQPGLGRVALLYLFKDEVLPLRMDSPTLLRDIEIAEEFYQQYNQIMLGHIECFQSFLSRVVEIELLCQEYNEFVSRAIADEESVLVKLANLQTNNADNDQ